MILKQTFDSNKTRRYLRQLLTGSPPPKPSPFPSEAQKTNQKGAI